VHRDGGQRSQGSPRPPGAGVARALTKPGWPQKTKRTQKREMPRPSLVEGDAPSSPRFTPNSPRAFRRPNPQKSHNGLSVAGVADPGPPASARPATGRAECAPGRGRPGPSKNQPTRDPSRRRIAPASAFSFALLVLFVANLNRTRSRRALLTSSRRAASRARRGTGTRRAPRTAAARASPRSRRRRRGCSPPTTS